MEYIHHCKFNSFFENPPTCTVTNMPVLEGEAVEVSCAIRFGGRWPPTMRMVDQEGSELQTQNLTETQTDEYDQIQEGTVRHVLSMNATRNANGGVITVRVGFEGPPPEQHPSSFVASGREGDYYPATNIPDYTHENEFNINVHCKYTKSPGA